MVSKVIPIMGPGCGNPELEKCPPSFHFELTEKEMMQAIKNPDMCSEILGLPPGTIKTVSVSNPLPSPLSRRPNPQPTDPTLIYCCVTCQGDAICCFLWKE